MQVKLVNGPANGQTEEGDFTDGHTINVRHPGSIHSVPRDACILRSNPSLCAHYEVLGEFAYYKGETATPMKVL